MTINRLNRDTFNLGLREVVYFTSSGTFTKATYPWLRAICVKVVGAGGGGGGCSTTTSTTIATGSGGGGGAYAESFITNIGSLGSSETITVGSGGAGGAAGVNDGSNGGNTSFGSLVSANGGVGGIGVGPSTPPVNSPNGGAGATTGTGDLIIPGERGHLNVQPSTATVNTASGGGNYLTPSNIGIRTTTGLNGSSGRRYGDGGTSGANAINQATARSGGAGANGIVIVELYA